jgi:hypothetical protein
VHPEAFYEIILQCRIIVDKRDWLELITIRQGRLNLHTCATGTINRNPFFRRSTRR